MKSLGSTKSKITKNKSHENMAYLEITVVILVRCDIVNNNYRYDSKDLYTFIPNQSFGQLLDFAPNNFIFLKTFKIFKILIMQKNLQQMRLKLLQKEQFKKQQNQLVI